jgi:hypothetical protein
MNRILAVILMSLFAFTPVIAAPLYAGIQIDDNSAGLLFGYPINKTYAVEVHYTKSNSRTEHAGVTIDTSSTGLGIAGIALFPMRLNDVLPYSLFLKGATSAQPTPTRAQFQPRLRSRFPTKTRSPAIKTRCFSAAVPNLVLRKI